MIIRDARGGQLLRVGDPGQGVHLLFSTPARPYGDDPALDIPVRAKGAWVDVSDLVRTMDGDGLAEFLSSLTDRSSSWSEPRTWQSSEGQLKISAQRSDSRIVLTWGMRAVVTGSEGCWRFETVTSHESGQEVRELSGAFNALLSEKPRKSFSRCRRASGA
ncbi:DUF6228 family protein [Streptomyces longwoodensis]|uniref:DUF6228 family protein n=1 Tax=Streptomyces longwoodensis TaxID=68231 RepID=UPI001FE2331F|nr:DUF6228 family protein [Streptomyces longwoodensis]